MSIFVALFAVSCSSEEFGLKYEEMLKKVPNPPTTIDEIMTYPSGILAGIDYKKEMQSMIQTVKTYLPPIEEDVDEEYLEDWWRVYYSLFAEEYPNPRSIYEEKKLEPFDHPYLHLDIEQFKEQINVLVILDVSGSMANEINGKRMIDIAKDSIIDFTSELPKEANVGLMVYGHKGNGSDNQRRISCDSVELVYDLEPFNSKKFREIIEPFEPLGWTPLAHSLDQAKKVFSEFPGEHNTNLIYVVSDGVETCDGNPVEAAASFTNSNIQPIINVIGFNVDNEGQQQLRDIAEAGKGKYTNAGNEEQLQEIFKQAEDMIRKWQNWKEWAESTVLEHYLEQTKQVEAFINDWEAVNDRERANIFSIINELRSTGYITEEAHSYFGIKRTERTYLYEELGVTTYKEILDKVTINYQDLMKKINKEVKAEHFTSLK